MDDEEIRLYLHSLLEAAFPGLGLYYRPPGNLLVNRPCIIYEPKSSKPSFANSKTYVVGTIFQVTILSDLPGYANRRNIFALPGIAVNSNSSYVSSDVVHDVFTVAVNSI